MATTIKICVQLRKHRCVIYHITSLPDKHKCSNLKPYHVASFQKITLIFNLESICIYILYIFLKSINKISRKFIFRIVKDDFQKKSEFNKAIDHITSFKKDINLDLFSKLWIQKGYRSYCLLCQHQLEYLTDTARIWHLIYVCPTILHKNIGDHKREKQPQYHTKISQI